MFESEGRNIDAVMIATPDHMHTPVALLAMQLGKYVYCEKPLTRTPWEAQLLADAAVKYKVATQMGNQGWNHEGTKTACEILWSGEIGEVKTLHAWTGGIYGGQPNLPQGGPEATAVPPTLDWDLWLGCAEPRSFNPVMTNQWRAFQDFSTGGSLGDWLVHNLGPAHLALLLDRASPTSVECVYVEGQNQWLWPLRAHVVYEFPARGAMPPVTVHTYQNMRGDFENPPGMAESERLFPPMNNLTAKGRPFVQGGDGMMLVSTQLAVDGKPLPRQGTPGAPPTGAGRAPGGPADAHGSRPPFSGASSDPKMRAPGNGAPRSHDVRTGHGRPARSRAARGLDPVSSCGGPRSHEGSARRVSGCQPARPLEIECSRQGEAALVERPVPVDRQRGTWAHIGEETSGPTSRLWRHPAALRSVHIYDNTAEWSGSHQTAPRRGGPISRAGACFFEDSSTLTSKSAIPSLRRTTNAEFSPGMIDGITKRLPSAETSDETTAWNLRKSFGIDCEKRRWFSRVDCGLAKGRWHGIHGSVRAQVVEFLAIFAPAQALCALAGDEKTFPGHA